MPYIILILFVVCADQTTKYLTRAFLVPGEQVPLIGDFFKIEYVINKGAAFGMMSGNYRLLVVLPAVIIIAAVCILFSRKSIGRPAKVALTMIMAGGISNLIDRVCFQQVTDMISFQIFPPVFNLADTAVVIGSFFLVFYVVFDGGGGSKAGSPGRKRRRH